MTDKIKLMPAHGHRYSSTVETFDHEGKHTRTFHGSQLKPVEVDEVTAHALRAKGWVDWQPREVPAVPLFDEPEKVRMMAPADGPSSLIIERETDGAIDEVLYGGRGIIEADKRDAPALRGRGFTPYVEGPALPAARNVEPGTVYQHSATGQRFTLGEDRTWHPLNGGKNG